MLDENNIIELTETGLVYVDETGNQHSIVYSDCYKQHLKNWSNSERIAQVKKVNNMDDEQLARWLEKVRMYREIGKRNPLTPPWADGPYIEFHTDPPTRFRFTSRETYGKVLEAIGQRGWKTFDQS